MQALLHSVTPMLQQATTDPHCSPDSWTLNGQGWVSLLWGHCSFLPGPGAHKLLFVPSKCLFPQSCGISVIKSHWPSKSNSWGFSVLSLDPQIGKSVEGPRTFATVWELLWYKCSPVCGSSAWHLYGRASGFGLGLLYNVLVSDFCLSANLWLRRSLIELFKFLLPL